MSNDTTPPDHIPDDTFSDDAARDEEEARAAVRDAEAASSLLDPAVWRLFAWVRGFVRSVLETDYENMWPGNLLRGENIWQWARYEMLDWLHPIEKLLRRILLIEAYALLESQALPPARPRRDASKVALSFPAGAANPEAAEPPARELPVRAPAPRPIDDPDHPEHWRVSFRILPPALRKPARAYVRMPLPRGDDGRIIPFRFRDVPWDAAPLARRFEAVIRICRKPAPFIRRLAFRLRRAGAILRAAIVRLCAQRPTDKFARDANSEAGGYLLERSDIFWSSS